jgi:hypothetical protein
MEEEVLRREVPYFDNTAIIERDGNPYGFFIVRLKRGLSPKEFEGYYTTLVDAERVVRRTEAKRREDKEKVPKKNGS